MTQFDPHDTEVVYQTSVQQVVADLVQLLRSDRDRYIDPRARALFDSAVIVGLDHAFKEDAKKSRQLGAHCLRPSS